MSKFQPLQAYETPLEEGYKLLPSRFSQLNDDEYVLTNLVGEHVLLPRGDLERYVRHELDPQSEIYNNLKSKHLLMSVLNFPKSQFWFLS